MDTELLACTFCGGRDLTVENDHKLGDAPWHASFWVHCNHCGAQGPIGGSIQHSGNLWKSRSPAPIKAKDMVVGQWYMTSLGLVVCRAVQSEYSMLVSKAGEESKPIGEAWVLDSDEQVTVAHPDQERLMATAAANKIVATFNENNQLLPLAGGKAYQIYESTDPAVVLARIYLAQQDSSNL